MRLANDLPLDCCTLEPKPPSITTNSPQSTNSSASQKSQAPKSSCRRYLSTKLWKPLAKLFICLPRRQIFACQSYTTPSKRKEELRWNCSLEWCSPQSWPQQGYSNMTQEERDEMLREAINYCKLSTPSSNCGSENSDEPQNTKRSRSAFD